MKRAALGSVLLALGILIAGPAPQALAHADLILSTPDDGARLPEVPTEIELTFSEDLLPETVVVSVEDSAGMVIRVLEYEVDGADVIVTWPPGLSGSDYTVNYRVVSQDGHPVSGSLAFTVDGARGRHGAVGLARLRRSRGRLRRRRRRVRHDQLGGPDGRDRRRPRGRHRGRLPLPGHPSAGPLVGVRRTGRTRLTRTGPHAVTTVQRSTAAGLGTAPIALIAVALGALALVATAVGLVLAGGSYAAGAAGAARSGRDRGLGRARDPAAR